MRRLLGPLLVIACIALTSPARGAEVTRVASSAEPGNPFDLDLTLRYERTDRRARIVREFPDPSARPPLGAVRDESELWYERVSNRLVPRVAVGLYHDLELHAELPWYVNDDASWKFTGGSTQSIANNTLGPDGLPCATTPCAIFPVGAGGQTVYHGGAFGDLTFGVSWGILTDKRDDLSPAWTVTLDVTAPTATRYDPAAGRRADFSSPYKSSSRQAPVGQKVWSYDLQTAISKRMGALEPYLRAHARLAQKSSQTYSNCEHLAELAAVGQASAAAANCALGSWQEDAAARPPHVFGLELGGELVPYEDKLEHQRFAIDLRVGGDYTSQARWYNELTDATGKLMWTDPYVTFRGLVGLYLRASSYLQLRAVASIAHELTHLVSGEPLGRDPGSVVAPPAAGGAPSPDQNPNFDWRYDLPGRRFRVSETTVFDVNVSGIVNF